MNPYYKERHVRCGVFRVRGAELEQADIVRLGLLVGRGPHPHHRPN